MRYLLRPKDPRRWKTSYVALSKYRLVVTYSSPHAPPPLVSGARLARAHRATPAAVGGSSRNLISSADGRMSRTCAMSQVGYGRCQGVVTWYLLRRYNVTALPRI